MVNHDLTKMYTGLLIGRTATILESQDPSLRNRRGLIIDETKNTFLFEEIGRREKRIRVPKTIVKIGVENADGGKDLVLLGSELRSTPEERIKG